VALVIPLLTVMTEQPSDFLRARLAKLPPLPTFQEDPIPDDVTDTSTETDSSTASVQTIIPTIPKPTLPKSAYPWGSLILDFKQNLYLGLVTLRRTFEFRLQQTQDNPLTSTLPLRPVRMHQSTYFITAQVHQVSLSPS